MTSFALETTVCKYLYLILLSGLVLLYNKSQFGLKEVTIYYTAYICRQYLLLNPCQLSAEWNLDAHAMSTQMGSAKPKKQLAKGSNVSFPIPTQADKN